MSHAGHKIVKCDCGQIIQQCRCADKNKPVEIVKDGCPGCATAKLVFQAVSTETDNANH